MQTGLIINSAKGRDNISTILPDHPVVAMLLRDGEPPPGRCCRCDGKAELWNDELGLYCSDCAVSLWDAMDDRRRLSLMGFEEI